MKLFYDNFRAHFGLFKVWDLNVQAVILVIPYFLEYDKFSWTGPTPMTSGSKKILKNGSLELVLWFFFNLAYIFDALRFVVNFFVCVNHSLRVHPWIFACALKLSFCAKGAQCYLSTKSVITFLGKADSIIQVGPDSLLFYLSMCKFVTTNKFNCHDTVAYI